MLKRQCICFCQKLYELSCYAYSMLSSYLILTSSNKLIKHRRSGTSVSTIITEFNICDRKEKGPVKCLMVAAVVAGQRFMMAYTRGGSWRNWFSSWILDNPNHQISKVLEVNHQFLHLQITVLFRNYSVLELKLVWYQSCSMQRTYFLMETQ